MGINMDSYTRFTGLETEELKCRNAALEGVMTCKKTITVSADRVLNSSESNAVAVGITASAASKTVTLGLRAGQILFVINEGSANAFTLKNVSGDTGTSVGAGKVCLVVGSDTVGASGIYLLN